MTAPPQQPTRSAPPQRQAPPQRPADNSNGRRTAPPAGPPGRAPSRPSAPVSFGGIAAKHGHRIVLYGPGGIGKTSLAVTAPGPVAVFDLDGSLPVLQSQLPTETREGIRTVAAPTWSAMLNALHAPGWESIRTIVVDTATLGEQLATRHVLATIPHEKTKQRVTRLEDYPFGKGYSFVFDVFAELLNALDAHARAGRHAVLVCHDCVTNCPNPAGQDWLRYEPRLQSPPSGKASIRLRVREWADHVLFVGYDINVAEGKGQGSGTRTIYPAELPHCMAKSRVLAEPIPLVKFDQTLWQLLLTL